MSATDYSGVGELRGSPMGEFAVDHSATWQSDHTDGNRCKHPDCEKLIRNGANTCKAHMMWYRREIQAKMDRLCEMARERRVKQLIHDWWKNA